MKRISLITKWRQQDPDYIWLCFYPFHIDTQIHTESVTYIFALIITHTSVGIVLQNTGLDIFWIIDKWTKFQCLCEILTWLTMKCVSLQVLDRLTHPESPDLIHNYM